MTNNYSYKKTLKRSQINHSFYAALKISIALRKLEKNKKQATEAKRLAKTKLLEFKALKLYSSN